MSKKPPAHEYIKKWRIREGFTQDVVAEKLGCSRAQHTGGELHRDGYHCCLGVYEVAVEPGSSNGDFNYLRFEVLEPTLQVALATLNDGGTPFPEIADEIERIVPVED